MTFAQLSDEPKIEIWPEGSEITQWGSSTIRGKVCPSPVPDTENITRPSEAGEILYPGSIAISFYAIKPDGSKITLEQTSYDRNMCDFQIGAGFDTPDSIGKWTFYATATWVSEGMIASISSNEVSVLVKPATFQPMEPELLTDEPGLYALLDWSPDGKYILGKAYSAGANALGLMDINTLEIKLLPERFDQLYDGRFSPSGDAIVILATKEGGQTIQVINYNLSDESSTVVAESESVLALNSALWLQGPDGERIVYGEVVRNEGKVSGYNIWTVRPDGSDGQKIQNYALTDEEYMMIFDSKEDKGLLIKRTKALGFPTVLATLLVFDVQTKESTTALETGNIQIPRFSPAGDVIIYDWGPGYKTPGGPLGIISIDGTLKETLLTGQPDLGNDPTSFVISPDGRYIVATMDRWTAKGAIITKTEFAHPMPEFNLGLVAILGTAVTAGIALHRLAISTRVSV